MVAALSRYASGRPWTSCASAGKSARARSGWNRSPRPPANGSPPLPSPVILDSVAPPTRPANERFDAPEAVRHQVDRLGGAAHEDDLARLARVDEAPGRGARRLVGGGRALGKRVHAAMHVGAVGAAERGHGVDHRRRHLRGRRAVQICQRAAVDQLRQRREVGARPLGLEPLTAAARERLASAAGAGHTRQRSTADSEPDEPDGFNR